MSPTQFAEAQLSLTVHKHHRKQRNNKYINQVFELFNRNEGKEAYIIHRFCSSEAGRQSSLLPSPCCLLLLQIKALSRPIFHQDVYKWGNVGFCDKFSVIAVASSSNSFSFLGLMSIWCLTVEQSLLLLQGKVREAATLVLMLMGHYANTRSCLSPSSLLWEKNTLLLCKPLCVGF